MDNTVVYSVEQVKSMVAQKFPDGVKFEDKVRPRRLYMTANKDVLFKLCEYLKDGLGFDHCSCVAGIDQCNRFQSLYHIVSYSSNITLEIVVDLPKDNPEVDSVTPLWGGANWHERETYDMYGIIFKNHPRLERILLPEDYQFFPMRKDCTAGRP